MDKAIIKENINRQLELIMEQHNSIIKNSGKIPQIEIDILKANIRKLYEQYCDLDSVNVIVVNEKATGIKESIPPEIEDFRESKENPLLIVHDKIKEEEVEIQNINTTTLIVDEDVEVIFTPEPKAIVEEKALEIKEVKTADVETVRIPNPVPEAISDELQFAPDIKTETAASNPITIPKTEIPIDLFGNVQTIADKYKTEKESLNEKLQKTKIDKSIGSRLQHHKIKDLKSSIGINEKFQFINELFKGNMKEYNESILIFNNASNLDEALNFLNGLKEKYGWKEDLPAYLTLKDFVERKHL
jgi:hypothetical protein